MKKISLILTFVMLFAVLFALTAFAAGEPFAITDEHIVSVKVEGKCDGQEISEQNTKDVYNLFDGNCSSGDSGWYGNWPKWNGLDHDKCGSIVTIELDKEYLVKYAELYIWTNWNNQVKIIFKDKTGKVTSSSNGPTQLTNGSVHPLAGSDFKAKTIVIDFPAHDGNGIIYLSEVHVMATEVPKCTHDIDKYMSDYTITTPATCTTPAMITYDCDNCGDEVTTSAAFADVTDKADQQTIVTDGAGGWTSSHVALFDNNPETYLHASSGWFVQSEITLNMNYYISSMSITLGSYYDNGSNGAITTLWYKAPGETEWIEAGSMATPVEIGSERYVYTLELAQPVLASAIKIKVSNFQHTGGQAFEAQVAGSILDDAGMVAHSWVKGETVAPTCVANGYTNYTCSACGATERKDIVAETKVHNYTVKDVEASVDATCTEAGKLVMKCATCTKTEETTVDALGHDVSIAATCTTPAGCSRCDYTEGTALGHDMSAATCTTPAGCSRCDYTEGEVGGHVASYQDYEAIEAATCMTTGTFTDTCEVCGETFEGVIPVDEEYGHRAVFGSEEYVDVTCQEDGYEKYTCSVCEEEIIVVYEASTDYCQKELVEEVPVTCQTAGYEIYVCALCGTESRVDYEASEYAHKYEETLGDGVLVYECAYCDASYEEELDPTLPYGDTAIEITNFFGTVYYTLTAGNYVLTFDVNDNVYFGENSELLETSPFAFTVAEGEYVSLAFVTGDYDVGTVNVNLASADNALLNGTYVAPDGSAMFVFADGALSITDTNPKMPSGFAGEYTYNYNAVTGEVANSANLPITVRGGVIYIYGRMPLNVYVPPVEAILGDNTFDFVCENYYFGDVKVVFTATEAGTYVITASETGMIIVESMYGVVELPFEVELAEGESFEFIVATSANVMTETEDTVVVNVAKKVTHVHTEVEIPAVLPTPSVTGYTAGVKCAECDEVLVAPKAIVVTEMEDPKDGNFRVASASLTLNDSIIVNYSCEVKDGYANPYMVFIFKGEEHVYTTWKPGANGRYMFSFDKPEASDMNFNIEAYVYAETGEGAYSMNKILEYSVKQYCVNQLKKTGDNAISASLRTLISDLLVMGAKTQIYSGTDVNNLVTDAVIAAGCTLTPTVFTDVNPEDEIKNEQMLVGSTSTVADWKSASVTCGSRTIVNLSFISTDIDNTVVYITVDGETKEYRNVGDTFAYNASNGRYTLKVDYLTSTQLNSGIQGVIEVNGTQYGRTLTYSVNTYICKYYNTDNPTNGFTQELRDLLRALYVYGKSAEVEFGK